MGGRRDGGEPKKKKKNTRWKQAEKKKKGLDFKSNSGTPDDLGHVTLPSVPSVWPVNIPLTPVKTRHSSFLTHRGAAVITPSPRDTEPTDKGGGERGSQGGKKGERTERIWRARGEIRRGKGVTFSPTAYLHALLLLSMYYSLDGH